MVAGNFRTGDSKLVWAATNKVRILGGSDINRKEIAAMQQSSSFSFKEILSRKESPQAVFDMGIDINALDAAGQTLLIAATIKNDEPLVQALLDHSDIDINLPDSHGRTALMYAMSSPHLPILEELLGDNRIAVNQQDSRGSTALMLAAALGLCRIVSRLLQQTGIEVNLRDNRGRTALMLAVLYDESDVVEELLRYSWLDDILWKTTRAVRLSFLPSTRIGRY